MFIKYILQQIIAVGVIVLQMEKLEVCCNSKWINQVKEVLQSCSGNVKKIIVID